MSKLMPDSTSEINTAGDSRLTDAQSPVVKEYFRNGAFTDPTRCHIGLNGVEHRRQFYKDERQRRREFRKQVFYGFMNLILIQPLRYLYALIQDKRGR